MAAARCAALPSRGPLGPSQTARTASWSAHHGRAYRLPQPVGLRELPRAARQGFLVHLVPFCARGGVPGAGERGSVRTSTAVPVPHRSHTLESAACWTQQQRDVGPVPYLLRSAGLHGALGRTWQPMGLLYAWGSGCGLGQVVAPNPGGSRPSEP